MMQAAEDWSRSDRSNPLNGTTGRHILAEGELRPDVIIISGIRRKDPAQVGLAEDDDVVEAFSTDRAYQPLGISVLPGRLWGCWVVPDTHGSKTLRDRMTISGVSVPNEMVRYIVPRKGISDLISDPFGRRIGGDAE